MSALDTLKADIESCTRDRGEGFETVYITASVIRRDLDAVEQEMNYWKKRAARQCTYDQWRAISTAIGDAMEYAHDRAIEHPGEADPLWNLDEYVSRVLKAAFPGSEV